MDGDLIEMSGKERDRLAVIRQVAERRLRQGQAAEQLDLTVRQVKRLVDYPTPPCAGCRAWRLSRTTRPSMPASMPSSRETARPDGTMDGPGREVPSPPTAPAAACGTAKNRRHLDTQRGHLYLAQEGDISTLR